MSQSKQNSTSEFEYWFKKNNYMGEFLSEKSLNIIKSIENRMGHKIGCIEEIALKNRWITRRYLKKTTKKYCNSEYGIYVDSLSN